MPFTCLSCSVIFETAELQRLHYKTDWHRYNLKRKVVNLPPITCQEFDRKAELQTKKKEEKLEEKLLSTLCKVCNKSFLSENAYQNHIKSKKHKELCNKTLLQSDSHKEVVKKSSTSKTPVVQTPAVLLDEELEDDDSDEWEDVESDEQEDDDDAYEDVESEALSPTTCLFCPHVSTTVEKSLQHMSKSHSFFIPDSDYVVDVEALMVYLGAKVGDGRVCLFCNARSKQFHSLHACRKHMIDKGHCKLDYEGDAVLEYADFYDFSSSYPDDGENVDVEEEISVDMSRLTVDPATLELVLPSGARAGHRALQKYYNQSIKQASAHTKGRAMITGLENHYRSLGLQNTTLAISTRRKLQARKMANFKWSSDRMALGVKANKLQNHFRKQVMYAG